ncbi:hypothetical protein E4U41_005763 [Claviceps citrina]|nr:hypothetical protein E4U41_005763 [Claviceps citrina]
MATSAAKPKASAMLAATSDIAHQLVDTGVWNRAGGRKKADSVQAVEPRRVNIVSDGLCDDILKYIGPSMERHRGCDLIDLNPGAGLWSRKLHEHLQPRKHIMMDLDAELYRPFLGDLLAKKNVELIRKSGFVWKDLNQMMGTHLTEQHSAFSTDPDPEAMPRRNDTLLVTANLSTYPKRSFYSFESMTAMVLYQFMASIRTSTLLQRYGLVRMLLWVNDEDKRSFLPRSILRRRKCAFETELSCEWLHEVAGLDAEVQDPNALRDDWLNVESASQTVLRMRAAGLEMPRGRETLAYLKLQSEPELLGQKLAGVRPPSLARPFRKELGKLRQQREQEQEEPAAVGGPESAARELATRFRVLNTREKILNSDSLNQLELLQERDRITQLARSSSSSPASAAEFEAANAAWNARIEGLKKNPRNEFSSVRDNYHLFRQSPPGLLWDRRAHEPLSVRPDDFFPNAPTALLDLQPKPMHPLFRQHGPASSRSGDMSELMLRFWFQQSLIPVQKAMDGLWAGFGDLIDQCPSVRDVARGGTPLTGSAGSLAVRAMNEAQWVDIMQAWMDWPFRPRYSQMLGRLIDDADSGADEEEWGAMGVMG